MVEQVDFENARNELVPSVSAEELGHYERVRRTFEGAPKEDPAAAQKNKSMLLPGSNAPAAPRPLAISNGTSNGGARMPPSRTTTNASQAPSTMSTNSNASGKTRTLSKLLRKAGGKGKSTSTFYFDKPNNGENGGEGMPSSHGAANDSDEDEYIIRTDGHGSSMNGVERKISGASSTNGGGAGSIGAGSGKMTRGQSVGQQFGDATEGDDDMYAFEPQRRK